MGYSSRAAASTSTAAGLSWSCLWGWAPGVWFAHSARGRLKRCPFGAYLELRIHLAPPVSPMRNYFLASGRAWLGSVDEATQAVSPHFRVVQLPPSYSAARHQRRLAAKAKPSVPEPSNAKLAGSGTAPTTLVLRFIRSIHRDAPVLVFPAKAGIHVWHGHRPSSE